MNAGNVFFQLFFHIAFCNLSEASICQSQDCDKISKKFLRNIDRSQNPCQDFYKYACGKYTSDGKFNDKSNADPSFEEALENIINNVRSLLKSKKSRNSVDVNYAKEFYQLCEQKCKKDEFVREIIQTLKLLRWPMMVESWLSKDFNIVEFLIIMRKMGFYFAEFNRLERMDNDSFKLLPLRTKYSQQIIYNKTFELEYYRNLANIATLLGANKSAISEEMSQVVYFEKKLAHFANAYSSDESIKIDLRVFAKHKKYVDWKLYINFLSDIRSLSDNISVYIDDTKYFLSLENLLMKTPKRTVANFLVIQIVLHFIPCLPEKYDKYLTFSEERNGDICYDTVFRNFPTILGKMYVENHFNYSTKNDVNGIIRRIMKSFQNDLISLTWLDEETFRKARDKLSNVKFIVGYPDSFSFDDGAIESLYSDASNTHRNNFLQLILNYYRYNEEKLLTSNKNFNYEEELMKLILTANAHHDRRQHANFIPASLLQYTFFSSEAPSYFNYGSLGSIIGHEVTHSLDTAGMTFDENGSWSSQYWASEQSLTEYRKRLDCLMKKVDSFMRENYRLSFGDVTLNEDLADMVGVRESYRAYNDWITENGDETVFIDGFESFTPKQMFWISYANVWCGPPEKNLKSSNYSPRKYRVNGPLSNLKDFSNDFNCYVDSHMNPSNKCEPNR